ncbi:MAG TPA: hypothetical protein VFD73_03045, partial [Gemmatimonadales bacterium]|nr:hypothetical protein [Gemmatimonadales bacterium]
MLVLVLVLMAGAALVIYGQSQEQRDRIQKIPVGFVNTKVKGVKPVDLTRVEQSIKAAASPPNVVLSGNHNLFNPVRWMHNPGQPLIKVETGRELGPSKLLIEKIRPLNLIITLERAVTSGPADQKVVIGYQTIVTNDMATRITARKIAQFMAVNET